MLETEHISTVVVSFRLRVTLRGVLARAALLVAAPEPDLAARARARAQAQAQAQNLVTEAGQAVVQETLDRARLARLDLAVVHLPMVQTTATALVLILMVAIQFLLVVSVALTYQPRAYLRLKG